MTTITIYDHLEVVEGPLPAGLGFWQVKQGSLQWEGRAATPSEARKRAKVAWQPMLEFVDSAKLSKEALTVRLLSGFPQIPGHELYFDETVLKGDCLPEADSPAFRVINSADDLDFYLLDVPSHAVFVPPFRAHTTQRGQWKSPTLDECRKRASEAIGAVINRDRAKGFSCE